MRKLFSIGLMLIMVMSILPLAVAVDATPTNEPIDGLDDVKEDKAPGVCCRALTAECMACSKGVSVDDLCKRAPRTPGCPEFDVNATREMIKERFNVSDEQMIKTREMMKKRFNLSEEDAQRLERLGAVEARKLIASNPRLANRSHEFSEDELEKLGALSRSRLKELAEKSSDEVKDSLKKVTVAKIKKEDAFKKRTIAKERVQAAKENYEEARKRYNNAKKEFSEEKDAWRKAVDAGDEEAAIEHAKNYLSDAADLVIESLEKIKARVESNDDLTDEEAQEIIDEVEGHIATIEGYKEELDAAQTKEEVKTVGKKIVSAWNRMKHQVEVRAEQIVKSQVGEIMSRSDALEQHLERILAEMEEDGVEIEDIDDKVDEFSELIASAKDKFEESEDLFKQAKESDDRDALNQSKTLVRDAHADLKKAHIILMDIVREVKAAGYDVEDDSEYVEVVEDESEDALDEIADADKEYLAAEEKIAERESQGKNVIEAKELLASAKIKLDEAKEAFDADNFALAEELAEVAKDLANEAKEGDSADSEDDADDDDSDEEDESDDADDSEEESDVDDDDSDDDDEDNEA